jgi:hypothetical protein
LVCHRLLHQLDRKAVEAWIMAHADESKALEFWNSLATLGRGDAWIWSPEWMEIFKRVHIRERLTFDSSFTPKSGEKPKTAKKLAEVDLAELKQKLAATIEKAKADDPRELRQQIAELRKELKQRPVEHKIAGGVVEKSSAADRAVIRNLRRGLEQAMKIIANIKAIGFDDIAIKPEEIQSALDKASAEIARLAEAGMSRRMRDFDSLKRNAESVLQKLERLMTGEDIELNVSVTRNEPVTVRSSSTLLVPAAGSNGSSSLPPGERAVLIAVAQFGSVEREQLTVLTGYKRSSRDAYVSRLAARGYVEVRGRTIRPTQEGINGLGGEYEPLPTGSALYTHWRNRLPEGELKILDILVRNGQAVIEREQLDDQTGYKRSSRDAYLSRLMAKQLIEAPQPGMVKAADALFD